MQFELNLASLPNHILYLEGVQLSYIKVYVHIFNLWQAEKPCFINNAEFARRTLLHKDTIKAALQFFEKNGILKRIQKGTKRYLIQPMKALEIENETVNNSTDNCTNNDKGGEARPPGGVKLDPPQGGKLDPPYNNKYNNKLNKSSYSNDQNKNNEQKHDFAQMMNEAASIKKNEEYKKLDDRPKYKGEAKKISNLLKGISI
jgi:hypothetical protein